MQKGQFFRSMTTTAMLYDATSGLQLGACDFRVGCDQRHRYGRFCQVIVDRGSTFDLKDSENAILACWQKPCWHLSIVWT